MPTSFICIYVKYVKTDNAEGILALNNINLITKIPCYRKSLTKSMDHDNWLPNPMDRGSSQGCQMVYFSYQKSQFGYILEGHRME
jgi:hypothetical protein